MGGAREPILWVLNLDADLELADPGHTTSKADRAHMAPFVERVARTLPREDRVLDAGDDAAGRCGRAWCPTPKARRALERAGARVPDTPPVEVLRVANERGLSSAIARLPHAVACGTLAEAEAALARPCPLPGSRGRWWVQRGFTFAGRGQRAIEGGALRDADLGWLRAWLEPELQARTSVPRRLYVSPFVPVLLEVALHGHRDRSGAVRRGRPTVQTVDRHGQWEATRRADGALSADERCALDRAFDAVAAALGEAGYFGPFGLDAFRWRGPDGAPRLHAPSEINARYTMGYPVGMGGWD
ncbi:MAG TPA: hypothetical protein RMH99_16415 [Sandaracinaceae bacterium LLY-WYZ-13_1]|nr:hypothetical protein [Sandaracinaceae bacterium LLY-WYZ-13_1]